MKIRVMKYGMGIFTLALFVSSAAIAGNLGSLPNTFSANTTATASEVNANFEAVRAEVDDNANTSSSNAAAIGSKQSSVTGTCTAGQAISQINADGSVVCAGGSGVSFSAMLTTGPIVVGSGIEAPLLGLSEAYDDGNSFDPASGVYTIPSDGVYQFIVNVNFSSAAAPQSDVITIVRLNNNGFPFEQITQRIQLNSSYASNVIATGIVKATAGDLITFSARYTNGTAVDIFGNGATGSTKVSGFKVY